MRVLRERERKGYYTMQWSKAGPANTDVLLSVPTLGVIFCYCDTKRISCQMEFVSVHS